MEIPQFRLFNFEGISLDIQVQLRPKSTWAEQLHSTHILIQYLALLFS